MTRRRSELLAKVSRLQFPLNGDTDTIRIPLAIAGVRFDFLTSSSSLAKQVTDYFASYVASGPALAEIYAEPLDQPELWDDTDPEFHVHGKQVVQRDFAAIRMEQSGASMEQGLALVAPDLDDALHNLLRWFLPRVFLKQGIFLLHGAGVVRDGKGYVFFGHSGAGKSTTVSMIRESDHETAILGDDAIIIQMKNAESQPMMYSAPLGCGYTRLAPLDISAPLAGLFSLQQDRMHEVRPLTYSEGIATLLASAMSVRFDDSLEDRIALASRFAFSSCGIKRLHFKRDPEFWELITHTAKKYVARDREEKTNVEQQQQPQQ